VDLTLQLANTPVSGQTPLGIPSIGPETVAVPDLLTSKQARMFILACLLVGLQSWQLACYLFACLIYIFDTVPERRRAAGAAREEEVEGAEGAISRHCGAVKGERE